MKNKPLLFLIIFLILVIAIGAYVIVNQSRQYNNLFEKTPYLLGGDQISYFEVRDHEKNIFDISTIKDNQLSLLFIFEEPCSPCNKNLVFWKRISAFYSAHVTIYGIVLKEYENLKDSQNSIMPNFKLFAPVDMKNFRKKMKAESKLAQTILIKGNTILYIKVGNLEPNDYFEIVKIINMEIK